MNYFQNMNEVNKPIEVGTVPVIYWTIILVMTVLLGQVIPDHVPSQTSLEGFNGKWVASQVQPRTAMTLEAAMRSQIIVAAIERSKMLIIIL